MLEIFSTTGHASFLAVIETLGGAGLDHLSFPMRGVTLALDLPLVADVPELLAALERTRIGAGGGIYRARDPVRSPAGFRGSYPRLAAFEATLAAHDPQRRLAPSTDGATSSKRQRSGGCSWRSSAPYPRACSSAWTCDRAALHPWIRWP
jgi:hypothetical protein